MPKEKCAVCNGAGWEIFDVDDTGFLEVQRCDACMRFKDDTCALDTVPEGVKRLLAKLNEGKTRPVA